MRLLDSKDRKILSCLLKDCRQTNTQIAKQCGLSREVVSYRITQLEKEGIIIGYTSDVNFNNLGYIAYSLGLTLRNISEEQIALLKKTQRIVYLQRTMGRFNLTCTVLIKNPNELKEEYDHIITLFDKELIEINSDMLIGDIDFSANIFENQNIENSFFFEKIKQINKTEESILKELVKESRQSVVKLNQKLNISVPTITKTIKELKNKKIIISNRVILDFNKLQLHKYTLLLFANPKIQKQLMQFCRQSRSIWDLGEYSGTYNYVIEIFAKNNNEFETTVNSIKEMFHRDIFKMEMMIVSEELKHQYFYS